MEISPERDLALWLAVEPLQHPAIVTGCDLTSHISCTISKSDEYYYYHKEKHAERIAECSIIKEYPREYGVTTFFHLL